MAWWAWAAATSSGAELDDKGQWGTPRNLGYPLNTFANEASLFVSSDNKRLYCTRAEPPRPGDPPSMAPPILLYGSEVPTSVRARETSTYAQGRVFDAVYQEAPQRRWCSFSTSAPMRSPSR